jgi:hypothetical protein
LPAGEPYPPFLLVVDVGHAIEIRADFSLTGRSYLPFPDPLAVEFGQLGGSNALLGVQRLSLHRP